MKQYQDLLSDTLLNGILSENRTGINTQKVFGRFLSFDLSEGFPILTTKRIHFKSVVGELLFFISGSTNNRDLTDQGIRIWSDWEGPGGELGPIYGDRWTRWGKPKAIIQPIPKLREGLEPSVKGIAYGGPGSSSHVLGPRWKSMIQRCYDSTHKSYKNYGGRGVYVCDRWLEFAIFAADAILLDGFDEENFDAMSLDKDGIGDGFCYGPEHCQWITDLENNLLRSNKTYTVVHPDHGERSFHNPTVFCREMGIPNYNFSDLWTGNKNAKVRHGWSLVGICEREPHLNQLATVIAEIKSSPDSRRLVVSAWDPQWSRFSALPPCHMIYQFQVQEGRLSCLMMQRSVDSFLGLPFNIASYALLTSMVAHVTGYQPGTLHMALGDTHIYQNHFLQVGELLSREPRALPQLWLNPEVDDIDKFTPDDVKLVSYKPHPSIKATVAV